MLAEVVTIYKDHAQDPVAMSRDLAEDIASRAELIRSVAVVVERYDGGLEVYGWKETG